MPCACPESRRIDLHYLRYLLHHDFTYDAYSGWKLSNSNNNLRVSLTKFANGATIHANSFARVAGFFRRRHLSRAWPKEI